MMMQDEKFDAETVKQAVKYLDDYLWNITSNIVCTICHEIFSDPITTPCSHSFCSNCLKRLLSGVKNTNNSCPLCRKSIKRREAKSNHILRNISKICCGLPAAFREDVMNLNPQLKEFSKDLVNGSRIAGFYLDKDKGKSCKNLKKQRKTNKKVSRDRILSASIVKQDGEETNPKNEEVLDLESISQIELKSQLYVAESPEIEKKLRTVKRVPSQQKVNDWLEKVGKTSDPSSSFLTDNWESRDGSIIQGTENKNFGRSVMHIDFGISEKSTETRGDNAKNAESDPYEFIASQRPHAMKPKRRANRGRKKALLGFQAIQNFTKDSVKQSYLNKTTDLFDDICENNLQKTLKTYSRKSDKTVTIGQKTQEILLKDYAKILSDSEESKVSESEIIPRAKRKILPLCPDIDSDSSVDNIKKPKIDLSIVTSNCESNSKTSKDEYARTKTLNTAKIQGKSLLSNGWTRGSNSKLDFEVAEKSRTTRRKSLDISGGEPSLNSSKKSITEQSLEEEILPKNDVQTEDLSQNSELFIGFEDPSSEEKKKNFKLMVEKMEKDLELEMSCDAKEFIQVNSTFTEESVSITPPEEMISKAPESKIIPFALLGKMRKKKRCSILFVKLGRLSPNLKRSRSTVVKLIFSKTIHKNSRKVGVAVGTQTDLLSHCKLSKGLETVKDENFDLEEHKKINVEIQTVDSCLRSNSKETQTSPTVEQKSVTVQTVIHDTNSEVLKECNPPPLLKTQTNSSQDLYLDSELVSQFNKTWITQGKKLSQNVKPFSLGKKELDNTVIDLVNRDTDVLIQRAINNINLDLARAKAVSRSPLKQPQQCEESDSDIFIEQTPPRNNSKNSSALLKTVEEYPVLKSEASHAAEESFLILSGCQSKISESGKTSKTYKHVSQQLKEKSFPKSFKEEGHENDRNELNRKCDRKISRDENLSDRRICIASSGVVNRENIEKFVNKFKIEHLSCPRKDMTHLVVGLHDNDGEGLVPYCTLKLLYAVANKKWVVTEKWIETCLKANAVVGEEPFESVDPAGGNGCSVARLSTGILLKNFQVYLLGVYDSMTKDEFSGLIADCGGTIIRKPSEFSFSSGHVRMILVDDSNEQDETEIRDLMRKCRTLVMSRDVIIMSIQSYTVVNFTPFLIQPVSYEEMIKWGYPPDLIKFDCENENDEAG